MNSEYDRVINWLANGDTMRATACCDYLADYLKSNKANQTPAKAELLRHLENHRQEYVDFFKNKLSACKAIETFLADVSRAIASGTPLDDIHVIYNESAMLSILLQETENFATPDGTPNLFESALVSSLTRFLELANNQVEGLCSFLLTVTKYFKSLNLGNARIFLVDLPIGNSLIVQLLHHLLSPLPNIHILRASLSRNDKKSQGITRVDLLAERIHSVDIKPNDVILYVDEWNTGANFKNICEHLGKVVPEDVFFFPAALLSVEAPADARYDSFCDRHDGFLKRWGLPGSQFRKILPPLRSPHRTEGYFFWSEKDRMAGFRKLQLHGAVFSSIDETIKLLHANREELSKAIAALLASLAPLYKLPETPEKSLPIIIEQFDEAYSDYMQCRENLLKCAEDVANGGVTENMTGDFQKLIAVYAKQVQGRPANLAFLVAGAYMERFGPLDPADRYYFKTHAPTLEQLTGKAGIVHTVTMEFLRHRIKAL